MELAQTKSKGKEEVSQKIESSHKSGNIYSSPDPKTKVEITDSDAKVKPSSKGGTHLAETDDQKEESKNEDEEKLEPNKNDEKGSSKKEGSSTGTGGGGALAAASALLMIRH